MQLFFAVLAQAAAAVSASTSTTTATVSVTTTTVDVVAAEQVVATAAQPASGKIIIYRPSSIIGAAVACPVRYKGREIIELGRGKFAEWQVPAGQYILTNKTSSVQTVVAPGETSYVRCSMKMGMLTYRADLQVVDRESFAEHEADFERKNIVAGSFD